MTVQEIINLALSRAHTKEAQIGSANALIFFNVARKKAGSAIIQHVDENYFYSTFSIDAVADQANGEYTLPEADYNSEGIVKIDRVEMKGYSTDTYFIPVNEIKLNELAYDWAWYLANQPKSEPIYYLTSLGIRIAPQFDADDITAEDNDQIRLHGVKKLIDLAADAASSDILFPDNIHYVIADLMVPDILRERGRTNEASNYESKNVPLSISEMISTLTNRTRDFQEARLPDESSTEYGE